MESYPSEIYHSLQQVISRVIGLGGPSLLANIANDEQNRQLLSGLDYVSDKYAQTNILISHLCNKYTYGVNNLVQILNIFAVDPAISRNSAIQRNNPLIADLNSLSSQISDLENNNFKWPVDLKFHIGIHVIIGKELDAVTKQFGIDKNKDYHLDKGAIYYHGRIRSKRTNKEYSVAVLAQGKAGQQMAGTISEKIIGFCQPKCMFLLGIAAGRKSKCKIGDVVGSRVIVDNTNGIIKNGIILPRMTAADIPFPMNQQLISADLSPDEWHARITTMIAPPVPPIGEEAEYLEHVASNPEFHEAAIYTSNYLLRDSIILEETSYNVNEQIRAGDMESSGFVGSCVSCSPQIPWYVVRGISDFGDEFKNDKFQSWAAHSAAAYLYNLLQCCIIPDQF